MGGTVWSQYPGSVPDPNHLFLSPGELNLGGADMPPPSLLSHDPIDTNCLLLLIYYFFLKYILGVSLCSYNKNNNTNFSM